MLRKAGYVPDRPQWPVMDEPLVLADAWPERVWLLTVRHTGTHYMFQILKRLGFFQGQIDWQQRVLKNHRYAPYFLHSHIEASSIVQYVCDEKAVMTMRNPVDVYRSHLNRYSWGEGYHLKYVQYCFDLFEKVRERYKAFVFRVDEPDQSNEVRRLADWLGVEYKYRELPKDINHDGRTRSVNQEPPNEILELANQYGY